MSRWLALACLLIASCLQAAEISSSFGAATQLEQFTRHDQFGGLKLSPDGQVLAAMAGKYGHGGLVFLDVKDRKVISGIQAPTNFEIFDFEWVSDTRVIYFIAERQIGQVRPTPTGEIFAIDRDGRGSMRAANVVVDLQDQVRFAVGYDANSKLAALWKPQPDPEWQSFELPGFREGTVIPRGMIADNAAALVTGVREGESLTALYRVDLQSRAIEKLYQHPEVDVAGLRTSLLMFTAGDVAESKLGRNYLHEVLGNDAAELRTRSPVHNAGRIEVPILLIHGKEDVRADYQHTKR